MRDVRLCDAPFDPVAESAAFARAMPEAGALASFVGQVRPGGGVEALELFHYAPLTLPGMDDLAASAGARWPLLGLLVVHRVGLLHPGDPIVLVCAAALHRREALAATDFVMDHLKSDSWFWKRERAAGEWRWVEPRAEDHADRARWQPSA